MKICVCVKWVLYTGIPFEIDEKYRVARQKNCEPIYTINRPDRCALESAIQLRNAIGGEIFAVTLGPPMANEALYTCLGRGADNGIHIIDGESKSQDSYLTALCLSRVIGTLNCHLILCGAGSCDSNNFQVPYFLGEMLDLPQISRVIKLEYDHEAMKVRATRSLRRGKREIVESSLPSVIGVEAAIAEPHYVSVNSKQIAAEKGIRSLSAVALFDEGVWPSPLVRKISQSLPRPRPKATAAPDFSASPAQRLQFIMTGGIQAKESAELLEGESEKTLEALIDTLKREKVI